MSGKHFKNGEKLCAQGLYPQAIAEFETAVKIAEMDGKPKKKCVYLQLLGSTLVMTKDYEKGVGVLQQCLVCLRSIGGRLTRGPVYENALYSLGYAFNALRRYKEAKEVLEELNVHLKKGKNTPERIRCLNHLSAACLGMKDKDNALSTIELAISLVMTLKKKDRASAASIETRTMIVAAKVQKYHGNSKAADDYKEKAVALYNALPRKDERLKQEIDALSSRGISTTVIGAGISLMGMVGAVMLY